MLIQSTESYKSIGPIQPPVELTGLTVVSGVNGAGKTHLLEAINHRTIKLSEGSRSLLHLKLVAQNGLGPNQGEYVSWQSLRQRLEALVQRLDTARNLRRQNPSATIDGQLQQSSEGKTLRWIAAECGKKLEDLDNGDIFEHFPVHDPSLPADIFGQSFSHLFKRYQIKQYQNDFAQFRHQKYGNVRSLSDEEFRERHGPPPWMLVNEIISAAGLDYHVSSPEEGESPDSPFLPSLINDFNGAKISFAELSSGEKVLMASSLALYNSQFDIEFPDVLLMDEPDSNLHPC
ncbi:MAG: hypothetical protein ACREDR_02735, partial [Blastocatellia bacterium]